MREMIKTFDQRYLAVARRIPGFFEVNLFGNCIEQSQRAVKEIMYHNEEILLKSWDSVSNTLRIMLKHRLETLPVVNVFRQVIGIVRIADVYKELALSGQQKDYWLKMASGMLS